MESQQESSSKFKSLRYGTSLKPIKVQRVCAKFPSRDELSLIDSVKIKQFSRPFAKVKAMGPRYTKDPPASIKGYPSISTVIGSTENMENLYRWQIQKIHEEGFDGMHKTVSARKFSGCSLHSCIEYFLKELMEIGEIKSSIEEMLKKVKEEQEAERKVEEGKGDEESKFDEESQDDTRLIGYLYAIRQFLVDLKPNPLMRLEEPTYHPMLCYNGRFDAILEIDGNLTLVDWKTVSSDSEKSSNSSQKKLVDLYSHPIQIAAYVAAVNCDPAYSFMSPIKHAAIVLIYEDGRPVEVIKMDETEIEEYFHEFCRRINNFWWKVENTDDSAEYVDFVYKSIL